MVLQTQIDPQPGETAWHEGREKKTFRGCNGQGDIQSCQRDFGKVCSRPFKEVIREFKSPLSWLVNTNPDKESDVT